jgi:hypothetical protein
VTAETRRETRALCFFALALTVLFHAFVVVRNFRGPIGDHSESFLYEYLSYYVSKNLTLFPFPHLSLTNNQIFYPFGTNGALQSWCVERDLFFSLMSGAFGRGPWLQLYYMLALVVSVFGSFAILRREFGDVRATFATVLVHLFNFYEMQKYPYHFNMSVLHWTTLGIVTDFVIVRRYVLRERISLRLIALRVLLLALGFGLELGHVVGYGLTSLFLSSLFIVGLAIARRSVKIDFRARWQEARADWKVLAAIAAGFVAASWLYGSLVAQIVAETRTYKFSGIELGTWWSHPIRLLIPYTPWLHPSQQPRFLHVFGDIAEESIGSGGAGWFLLALAAIGVYQARKRILPYVPILAMLALYVLSTPSFDPVRKLPWFAFVRVLSRATLVYSALFGLLAIEVSIRRSVWPVLGALGALELVTIGMIKFAHPAYAPDANFLAYTDRIKAQPGEALLDFPFCILGGNGDIGKLCPTLEIKSVYALQRFHGKKVIGQYLGRVHPSQVKPFVDAGWSRVFDPDDPDPHDATRLLTCLTDREWEFFADFYQLNDFAGIQLAVDRLPPGCADQFYARFGQPVAEMQLAKAGKLVFIPKTDRSRVDVARGKAVSLPLAPLAEADAVSPRRSKSVIVDGLSGYEVLEGQRWRWAVGPETTLRFKMPAAGRVDLKLRARNPIADQAVTVELDGKLVTRVTDLPVDQLSERTVGLVAGAGEHSLRLGYLAWNGQPGHKFAPDDPRPMAMQFYALELSSSLDSTADRVNAPTQQ